MSGISGIIKLLHSKHGNTFPITTTDAVYSKENGERLDEILNDVMLSNDEHEYSGVEPRDADTLGGRYTADSIDVISSKIGNLEELPTTEKGSVVGAVKELNSQMDNAKIGWYILLEGIDVNSGSINHAFYNNRKLSDYDMLIFTVEKDGNFRNPSFFPRSKFTVTGSKLEIDYSNADTTRYILFLYSDDTSVDIRGTEGAKAYLYGINLFH